ncbi:ABC transporter ATP-binding protein [Lachnoclostridium sp.]|uniref:ABC transporter ATP-binding protein n=1 Tax=Lachnoclostridium sp. TaxID=2028282 RepID=UPI0028986C24|nr:ABC transporter ATP-binding protein [Lachnoclostridium sp.]
MKEIFEVGKKNKKLILYYIVTGILIAFFQNFNANYLELLINNFENDKLNLGNIILYGCAMIILGILNYIDEYPARSLEHGLYLEFKMLAMKKICRMDYLTYQSFGTGSLIQRLENGVNAGKQIIFDFYLRILRELIPSILFSLIFIAMISKKVVLLLLLGYGIIFVISNLLLRALYRLKEKVLTDEEMLNHTFVRAFMEMVVFRLHRRFPNEMKRAEEAKDEIVSSKVKMTLIHEAFFTLFGLFIILIKIGIVLYAWYSKSISVGEMVALIMLVEHAYTPVAIFNVLFVQYKLDKISYARFKEFLSGKDDVNLYQGAELLNYTGEISFRNVSFSYGSRNVLQNINLEIRKGEKLALIGGSGSGKSTFLKLALGLLKPIDGEIFLDNKPMLQFSLDSFYQSVCYLSQEAPIFDGTLRENICVGQSVSDDRIISVLKKVQLYSLYCSLEHGLDQKVGERGLTISGGERQRLALARLWFHPASLVILDEPTSAMDNQTQEKVLQEVMSTIRRENSDYDFASLKYNP